MEKKLLKNGFIYKKTHFITNYTISVNVKPAFEDARFVNDFNLIIGRNVDCVIGFSNGLNSRDAREEIINKIANYMKTIFLQIKRPHLFL